MNKKIKIFKNETNVYSGKCYVNTVIFRGRIYNEFKKVGQDGIKFSLQLSNGKERVVATEALCAQAKSRTMLGEHNDTNCSRFYSDEEKSLERRRKPTFVDCTAFGETAKRRVAPRDKSRLRLFKFRVGVTRRRKVLLNNSKTASITKALLYAKSSLSKRYSAEPAQAIRA